MPRGEFTYDPDLGQKIVKLREEGNKWDEIAETLEIPSGKAMLFHAIETLPKKERIKNATDEDIVRLRDEESLSWGDIVARTMIPEGSCRSRYEKATGKSTSGNRIGKGGRYPSGFEPEAKPAKVKTEKAGKAGKAAKAADAEPSEASKKISDMDPAEAKEFLARRAIKVSTGSGAEEAIKIRSVKTVKNGVIALVDADTGKARSVKIATITAVSKALVVKE